MKKIFFLAAAMAASMSLMAQVEFHYLPTAGDKNAAGVEFTKSDKVEVAAGEQFIAGENFDVFNAYKTTYKVVGMVTDTAYSHLQIGDVVVTTTKNAFKVKTTQLPVVLTQLLIWHVLLKVLALKLT